MPGTVLVTDARRGSAVVAIRSLAAAGWRVVAADPSRLAPGRHSRATSVSAGYPDPVDDPAGAVDAIVELARTHRVDLLVPVTDDIGSLLDEARLRLPPWTRLAAPEPEVRRFATDKAETIALAQRLGVPVPETVVLRPDEHDRLDQELGWPVVVKPAESRQVRPDGVRRLEVAIARDERELRHAVASLAGSTVLLQAFVAGEGHGVELLVDRGRPVAVFQHRRIREVPLAGGPSSLRESIALDPDLAGHSTALLAEVGWTGLAMVEWKVGPAGPVLMEINGRFWGSLPLAVAAGVDFPRLLGDIHASAPSAAGPVPAGYAVGVRSRSLELELRWIAAVLRAPARTPGLRRRDAAAVALSLLDPRTPYDIQSRHDPVPGVLDLVLAARRLRWRTA